MKKAFVISLFILFNSILFINNAISKDLASMGATGYTCDSLKNHEKEDVKSEIVGFLNGLNLQLMVMDDQARLKIINHNTIEFAYQHLVNHCIQDPEGSTIIGVYMYYKSLPNFSD